MVVVTTADIAAVTAVIMAGTVDAPRVTTAVTVAVSRSGWFTMAVVVAGTMVAAADSMVVVGITNIFHGSLSRHTGLFPRETV